MPQIDVGTFTVDRFGGPPTPVAFAWRPVNQTYEVWALYHVDDPNTGFIRPGDGITSVGYTFAWIPKSAAEPDVALDHVNTAAFVDWIATNYGIDPTTCLSVFRCTPTAAGESGTASYPDGVLRPGIVHARLTASIADQQHPMDDVVAMAWHPGQQTAREIWALRNPVNGPGGFRRPGTNNRLITYWFFGRPGASEAGFVTQAEGAFGTSATAITYQKHRVD